MSSSGEIIHSINHLLELRTSEHPELEVLAVPNTDLSYTRYTYKDISSAASLLANYYNDQAILAPRAKGDTESRLTVALLSHSGWDYVVQELALIKMGYCVLFISYAELIPLFNSNFISRRVNNAPAAISHLLGVTNSSHIVVHPHFLASVEEALSLHPPKHEVGIIHQVDGELYSPEQLEGGGKTTTWKVPLMPEEEQGLPAFIVHSSGSTGFPKPIVLSHIASVRNFSQHFGLRGFTTLPLYHNHGHSCFYRAIHAAARIYLFPQSVIPLTTTNICTLLTSKDCDAEALFGVPYVLKILAEDSKGLEVLKGFRLVMFGGSACPDELGDRLVDEGVNLVGHYGLTEMGQIFTSFRDFKVDKGWNWLRGSGPFAKKGLMDWIRFEHYEEDKFELIVLDGYPTKVLSNRPDGSYSTKDLFIMHPTVPDAFKFVGRIDDTLVMVNGEKTNPVPMELTLRQSQYISEAVVFGAGRSQTGAMIILAEGISPSLPVDRLMELVQPAVALANSKAPTHSQLTSEALVFLPYETRLPKADKGSFLRPKVYAMFKDVIDGVYRTLEGEGDDDTTKEAIRDLEHAKEVVRAAVIKAVDKPSDALTDDTDLFAFGLDSLQSTRIRNSLQRGLDLNGKKLPTNFVFEHPSVNKMGSYLVSLVHHTADVVPLVNETDVMLELVEKYSRELLSGSAEASGSNGEHPGHINGTSGTRVVLLTGATGSLGASLLERLLLDDTVAIVYSLSRATDDNAARRRVVDGMKERGLYTEFDRSRLVCFATSDFGAPFLGIAKTAYETIASSVSHVIHNAWPVNFNWTISSFEPHIRGAVNLMKLAQVRHAKFFFSSSISAVFYWPGPGPVPEAVTEDPTVAQHMGYARSKWTVEKLCQVASETVSPASVLRIGQMVGDSRTGVWNETEAVSLMIKSADTIKVLPDLDESVSWLPVDFAARCITELAFRPTDETLCWHVVQPRLVHWRTVLDSLQKSGMKFDVVPTQVWLDRLRSSNPDPVANPTIKLLAFYEGKYSRDPKTQPQRFPLDTSRTEAASESLRTAPAPDDALVGKWVAAWRKNGFLH